MTTPGERLKACRIGCGFSTAKDAAIAMKIAVSTYTQHENGRQGFPVKRATVYAAFYKTSPEWLLFGDGEEAPDGPANPSNC